MWWPRWTRRQQQQDDGGWPGPPHPLPGGGPRHGDAWADSLPARPVTPWDQPAVLLPTVQPTVAAAEWWA